MAITGIGARVALAVVPLLALMAGRVDAAALKLSSSAFKEGGDRRSVPEGFGNTTDSTEFIGGTGSAGNRDYMGPCPIPLHTNHYVFTLYALDLDRTALRPGLTRDRLLAAMSGHVLDIGSLVGRAPSRQRSGPGMPAATERKPR